MTINATTVKCQRIKIAVGTDGAYEFDVSSTNPMPVGGSGASALGKAEDAAHTSGDVGVMALMVRKDTAAAFGADGDYTPHACNSLGAGFADLNSDFRTSAAKSVIKIEDEASASLDAGLGVMFVRNSAETALTSADGDYGFPAIDDKGRVKIDPGSNATSLGKQEDNPHTSLDVGVMCLAVRQDTAASSTSASGDYSFLASNSFGSLKIDLDLDFQRSVAKSPIKAEDGAFTDADAGLFCLGIRADTPPTNAGTSADGDYAGFYLNNAGGLYVTELPTTKGGETHYRNLDIDETGVSIKASAGQVYDVHAWNRTTSARYLKLYDISAAPTVGTTTPVVTIPLEPSGTNGLPKPTILRFKAGMAFASGIGIGCTTGFADNDTGAPGANDVIVSLGYK